MAKHGEDREDRAPRVAASPGKPMLGGKIGRSRRGEDNRSDDTMARTILEMSEHLLWGKVEPGLHFPATRKVFIDEAGMFYTHYNK